MKKRFMALLMTMMLVGSSVMTVGATVASESAATVVSASTAHYNGNKVNFYSSKTEAEADSVTDGYYYLTDGGATADLSDTTVQEIVEDMIAASSSSNVTVDDVSVLAVVGVEWEGDDEPALSADSPLTVTLAVSGVTADNFVGVMYYDTASGTWVAIEGVTAADGTITLTLTDNAQLSSLAILTTSTGTATSTDTPTTTVSGDDSNGGSTGGQSSKTGDISLAVPIALLVVAAAAIVVLLVKGKKNEAE